MIISSGPFGQTIIDDPQGWSTSLHVDLAAIDAEYAEKIRKWREADTELGHSQADKLLCELLTKFGMVETVKEFEAMDKWYA